LGCGYVRAGYQTLEGRGGRRGPGGLEAARVAALRGHEVTLFEARDELGGGLELWARLPGREFYRHAIDWWRRELSRLASRFAWAGKPRQTMCLHSRLGLCSWRPARVSAKTGRAGIADRDIPGADGSNVFCPEDILQGKARLTGRVVVLDGKELTPVSVSPSFSGAAEPT